MPQLKWVYYGRDRGEVYDIECAVDRVLNKHLGGAFKSQEDQLESVKDMFGRLVRALSESGSLPDDKLVDVLNGAFTTGEIKD